MPGTIEVIIVAIVLRRIPVRIVPLIVFEVPATASLRLCDGGRRTDD